MNNIKYILRKSFTKAVKFISKIFATELIKIYIFPLIAVISLGTIFLFMKTFLLKLLLLPITSLPNQLLLGHILFFFLVLSFIIILWFILKGLIKPSYYYFIEEGGFKWRVSKNTGQVEKAPFCITHQVKLVNHRRGVVGYKGSVHNFYCDYCKEMVAQNVKDITISSTYEKVKRLVEAKRSGYAKI